MASPKQDPRLRLFQRYDGFGRAISGSTIWRYQMPRNGQGYWADITDCAGGCCLETTTTTSTTTTTTSSTTTTTTTTGA